MNFCYLGITTLIWASALLSSRVYGAPQGAARPKGYGLTAELASKRSGRFDRELATQAMTWINEVLGENRLNANVDDANDVHVQLKDGRVLCELINRISGANININPGKMAFKQMENINNFLIESENYGVMKGDLFQVVDLYEAQNIPQVVAGIHALGRKAQTKGFDGAVLGPREATVAGTETAGDGIQIIGLQQGSNKGASQAGQNFGKTRAIVD